MAKKKIGKPKREVTKRQLSHWQQQKRRRRIILSLGSFVVAVVLVVIIILIIEFGMMVFGQDGNLILNPLTFLMNACII